MSFSHVFWRALVHPFPFPSHPPPCPIPCHASPPIPSPQHLFFSHDFTFVLFPLIQSHFWNGGLMVDPASSHEPKGEILLPVVVVFFSFCPLVWPIISIPGFVLVMSLFFVLHKWIEDYLCWRHIGPPHLASLVFLCAVTPYFLHTPPPLPPTPGAPTPPPQRR